MSELDKNDIRAFQQLDICGMSETTGDDAGQSIDVFSSIADLLARVSHLEDTVLNLRREKNDDSKKIKELESRIMKLESSNCNGPMQVARQKMLQQDVADSRASTIAGKSVCSSRRSSRKASMNLDNSNTTADISFSVGGSMPIIHAPPSNPSHTKSNMKDCDWTSRYDLVAALYMGYLQIALEDWCILTDNDIGKYLNDRNKMLRRISNCVDIMYTHVRKTKLPESTSSTILSMSRMLDRSCIDKGASDRIPRLLKANLSDIKGLRDSRDLCGIHARDSSGSFGILSALVEASHLCPELLGYPYCYIVCYVEEDILWTCTQGRRTIEVAIALDAEACRVPKVPSSQDRACENMSRDTIRNYVSERLRSDAPWDEIIASI